MKINKILLIIIFFISSDGFAQNYLAAGPFNYNSCFLQYIRIEGETNVNHFDLTFDNSRSDIISVSDKNRIDKSTKSLVEFKIPVKGFKGSNYLMENDFQDLLDASDYPLIVVGIEKKIFNHILLESVNSTIDFNLTIAGITNHISGEYMTYCKDDAIVLHGSAEIKLTDFSIDPPQKMFGMLQVKNLIIIKFDILISNINS